MAAGEVTLAAWITGKSVASSGTLAATEGSVAAERTVIGKVNDIGAGKLLPGEKSLLARLPNQGSPQANWKQNSGVLRQEMGKGLPIRDASVDSAGNLTNNTGFLKAERNLLQNKDWTYSQKTQTWNPPESVE